MDVVANTCLFLYEGDNCDGGPTCKRAPAELEDNPMVCTSSPRWIGLKETDRESARDPEVKELRQMSQEPWRRLRTGPVT